MNYYDLGKAVNEQIRESENMAKVFAIGEIIEGFQGLAVPHRRHIFDCTVTELPGSYVDILYILLTWFECDLMRISKAIDRNWTPRVSVQWSAHFRNAGAKIVDIQSQMREIRLFAE